MKQQSIDVHWYDVPRYYDLALSADTRREASFIEKACEKYLSKGSLRGDRKKVLRLLEPGCGTGRLVAELSRRGHDLYGFDASPLMIDFARKRLARRRLRATLQVADMRTFQPPGKFDAAYNLVNTFRHLLTLDDARAHLRHVSANLKRGGIYILGMILVPEDTTPEEASERWTVRRGQTRVTVSLSVPKMDLANRRETMRTVMTVRTPTRTRRFVSEEQMRIYTPRDAIQLFEEVRELEPVETYDFWYDINRPEPLSDRFGDVVFILRKDS